MDADGTHVQVINTNPAYLIRSPVMSPDGSKVAFLTQRNRDALAEVDIIDINWKNQHSLTDGYQLTYGGLSWSPDGQQLIFSMNGDGMNSQGFPPAQLFFVNADGSDLHKLNETCSYCVWADWGH
jgi:Tol biopolymer transport system component